MIEHLIGRVLHCHNALQSTLFVSTPNNNVVLLPSTTTATSDISFLLLLSFLVGGHFTVFLLSSS